MGLAISTCGQTATEYHEHSSTSRERLSRRQSQLNSDYIDSTSHTPPPEVVSTAVRRQSSSVSVALDSAFASEEEQPTLFPPSIYRTPTRSRTWPKPSPSRPSDSFMSTERTPEPRPSDKRHDSGYGVSDARERSYSPMSAGFARLNRRGAHSDPLPGSEWRGRTDSSRSMLDLEAKMFTGAA